MFSQTVREIRWVVVALATLLTVLCMGVGIRRIHVESDLSASIPAGDQVLSSGRQLLAKHPLIDWVAVDLSVRDGSSDSARLHEAAAVVERSLVESGQFSRVGSVDWESGVAALRASLPGRLPNLFSKQELEQQVAERLSDGQIRARLAENLAKLGELDGIGQAQEIGFDPLGLRELVYERLAALAPKTNARVERNHLLSPDGRHLLLTAVPERALGDPESSQRIAQALETTRQRLEQTALQEGKPEVVLTTAGAYRAAIDNETVVKRDTVRAVWLVTLAISVLLLVCFSRPLYGVLTLLPATAGVAIALLLYSFFNRSMSALSLGFGAALISITVDQGIVYIAYLDRVRNATGKRAARQTFSAVSLATLTTVGGFFSLTFSGYRLLEQLGMFAALGSAFSFLFVHSVFPLIFRGTPSPAGKPLLPFDAWLRRLSKGRVRYRVALALALGLGLGAFARPTFSTDLNRLNTISVETRADEERLRTTWGDLTNFAYVLVEAHDTVSLQQRTDRLDALLRTELGIRGAAGAFSPSSLWPGRELAENQLRAWKEFWTESRRAEVKLRISSAGSELGFAASAFDEFFRSLDHPDLLCPSIPEQALSMLAVTRGRDGNGWVWLKHVEREPHYDAVRLNAAANSAGFFSFDAELFGRHLNEFLGKAFMRMLLVLSPFVLCAVALSFQNLRLIALVLLPVVLALAATLGSLGLLGRPIDIPGLLISVVVLGMGTNFSVYLVNAHQRYPDPDHPVHDSVRIAGLLDGGATVLGMAVLAGSTHLALQSVGLVGLFGIGFSLIGALVLLPPILRATAPIGGPWRFGGALATRFLSRFQYLEPKLRWRARHAARDTGHLATLERAVGSRRTLLVVGETPGIEAAWLIASNPNRFVYVVEFDEEREHVTRAILGDHGSLIGAEWRELDEIAAPLEAAVITDLPANAPLQQRQRRALTVTHDSCSPNQTSLEQLQHRLRALAPRLASDARLVVATSFARIDGSIELLASNGFVRQPELCSSRFEVFERVPQLPEGGYDALLLRHFLPA